MKKKILLFSVLFLLFCGTLFADGDWNIGIKPGDTPPAHKAYYRLNEYMYKVHVYVGKNNKVNTKSPWSDFMKVGETVIYKSNFNFPVSAMVNFQTKFDGQSGSKSFRTVNSSMKFIADPALPPVPVTHKGSLAAVKRYFGKTGTLQRVLEIGTGGNVEGTLMGLPISIEKPDGTTEAAKIEDILPYDSGSGRKNKVPWVVVYEPMLLLHHKSGVDHTAMSATDMALLQMAGMPLRGTHGEDVTTLFRNLPNSAFLTDRWFGFSVVGGMSTYWPNDRIVQHGGYGMRYLAGKNREVADETKPPISGEELRTDTDVYFNFRIRNRGYTKDDDIGNHNSVTVEFFVNGTSIGTHSNIVLKAGTSQLAWVKYHTPDTPQTLTVTCEVRGGENVDGIPQAANVDAASKTYHLIQLEEKIPPDPKAKDPATGKPVLTPTGFSVPTVPKQPEVKEYTWHYYTCYWVPYWVDGEDHGNYEYDTHSCYAKLIVDGSGKVKPDIASEGGRCFTATEEGGKWTMKSGYGIKADIQASYQGSGTSDITNIQNSNVTFPEFGYVKFNRFLEENGGIWRFKENKYSTYKRRVHFTPLWFPDGMDYTPHIFLFDCWCPAGEMKTEIRESIHIEGNVYDDYTVIPWE